MYSNCSLGIEVPMFKKRITIIDVLYVIFNSCLQAELSDFRHGASMMPLLYVVENEKVNFLVKSFFKEETVLLSLYFSLSGGQIK
jgi:hypothetical protein